ncbi:nuclear transport factor 2 family protein [bacterium]|nr:nuclear transport factor 2 family protein [bacterium]
MKRVLLLVMLVVTGALVLAACNDDNDGSGSSRAADPVEVVEGYVAAYNAQDIDAVMAFFAEDAVIVDGTERIEGAEAIRAEELGAFEFHAPGGEAYSISNVVVTDNAVTWDRLFEGIAHTCVGTGDEAVVEDGKIVMWTFASVTCD